ncbi:uncharacterized protein LOC116854135 [Odontomachus brunneus]|uniref:uncharacterized protein LOC116854135 n=1 Tax=Odontomachus brunneus TaxID=486640 RepID=UPI0013F2A535|nr:uncharacterized protein LOC116854135 [Odontomachus brunneus]
MNDSFLEDLGLVPEESKKTYQPADCYITTRHATSSPLLKFSEHDERNNIMRSQKVRSITVSNMPNTKITGGKNLPSKDSKKLSDQNMKKHSMKVKVSEKNESKTRPMHVKIKMDNNQQHSVSGETKIKLQETKHLKLSENKTISKEYNRRSGSYKETTHPLGILTKENKCSTDYSNNYSSDTSSKDNSRPSDSSKESGPQDTVKEKEEKEYNRCSGSDKEITHPLSILTKENKCFPDSSNNHSSDTSSKDNSRPSDFSKESDPQDIAKEKEELPVNQRKSGYNIQNQDPVVLLTAIKELISTYTKQESTKILRIMQELHINSQATLIKNLLNQTDDLIKEMHPSKDSTRLRMLIEENERLQQELIALKAQNDYLQSKLEECKFLKQENAALRLKYDEQRQT